MNKYINKIEIKNTRDNIINYIKSENDNLMFKISNTIHQFIWLARYISDPTFTCINVPNELLIYRTLYTIGFINSTCNDMYAYLKIEYKEIINILKNQNNEIININDIMIEILHMYSKNDIINYKIDIIPVKYIYNVYIKKLKKIYLKINFNEYKNFSIRIQQFSHLLMSLSYIFNLCDIVTYESMKKRISNGIKVSLPKQVIPIYPDEFEKINISLNFINIFGKCMYNSTHYNKILKIINQLQSKYTDLIEYILNVCDRIWYSDNGNICELLSGDINLNMNTGKNIIICSYIAYIIKINTDNKIEWE